MLASLNHPNIAAIYGFEEGNAVPPSPRSGDSGVVRRAPFVLWCWSSSRGRRSPIASLMGRSAIDEAIPIARQIAEALEAAHEQGIIHRDLKPANTKVRPDGTVKVLDFGLAKALEPAADRGGDTISSPTITSPAMTALGVLLGTAAYMSPEQVRGRQADKRSDVWAFGAVLYEMLSGQRAFRGDDVADTLAAVLRQEIDWTRLPSSTPPSVRRLIERCLDRDVRRRLRDIGEARIALDDVSAVPLRDTSAAAIRTPPPVPPLWRRAIPILLAAIAAAALAGTAAWYLKPSTPLRVTRFEFIPPDGQPFTGLARRVIDISPDSAQIVYAASGRLYLRLLSQLDAKSIPGSEIYQAVTNPVFSPDGRSVAFYATSDQTIKRIAVTGGTAVTLCTAAMPLGMSWGPDGVVFSQGSQGISLVAANDSTPPRVLGSPRTGEVPASPQMLPGGQHVLFALTTGTAANRWDTADIVAQSVATGERTLIIQGGGDPRYVPTGHIVYAVGGTLYAVRFDEQTLKTMGSPAPVVEGVRRALVPSDGANFGISGDGTLAYIPGTTSLAAGQMQIALDGSTAGIEPLKLPPGQYAAPRVSPDGTRIAFGADDGTDRRSSTPMPCPARAG